MDKINSVPKNSSKWKFILFSTIGFFLFLVPIPHKGSFTISVGILIDMVKGIIGDYTLGPIVVLISINAVGTILTKILKPSFVMNNKWLTLGCMRSLP